MWLHPPAETPPIVNFTEPTLMYELDEQANAATPLPVCLIIGDTDSIGDGIMFDVDLDFQASVGSNFDPMNGKNLAVSYSYTLTLI